MKTLSSLLVIAVLAGTARADGATDARAHFQAATGHFAVGEFAEAAEEYQAAYKLKQDPALLYNAAQAFRLAGNHVKALILYKNYIQLYPRESNLEEVRAQIQKLRDAIAATEKAKTAPPTSTAEPHPLTPDEKQPPPPEKPHETAPATTATAPAATATAPAATTTREAPTPVYKRWWLWTVVGVAVAGGVVAGVVVGTRPSGSWSNAPDVGPGVHALVQF
jgi:tetratricopeptide (TPR) repeat protein